MLVLSRKVGESIMVGNQTEITILSVLGKRARIGIRAPCDVRILRGELDEWSELSFGESGLKELGDDRGDAVPNSKPVN